MQAAGHGPYGLLPGSQDCTSVTGAKGEACPVLRHIRRLVDGTIAGVPAIKGGFTVTTVGWDFNLDIGPDISSGCLSHSKTNVDLRFEATLPSGCARRPWRRGRRQWPGWESTVGSGLVRRDHETFSCLPGTQTSPG
jgi:uncharacterized linocin/CFP29 family protein